jgi:ornithine cyclodeaminase/alanine dehydrogenase-like protein (mu-crystallin family)
MHVHALGTLAPSLIHVVGRDPDRTRSFCRRLSDDTGLRLVPMTEPITALRGCEAVVTATSAQTAVLDEADIPPSAAVVHVGAKATGASELPASLYRRANYLFTDAPAELAARFFGTVVHAAGRRIEEVLPLSGDACPTSDSLRLYISLGVSGAEAILARALLGILLSTPLQGV